MFNLQLKLKDLRIADHLLFKQREMEYKEVPYILRSMQMIHLMFLALTFKLVWSVNGQTM